MLPPLLCFGGEPLIPDRDSYSLPLPYGAVTSDLPGGPVRVRANTLNNSVTITVQYTLDACQTDYFCSMYYGALREGQLPVKARLDLNGHDLVDETEYVCTILGAQFPQYTGIVNTVSVTYNAVPIVDRCLMAARALMYEALGGYPDVLDHCLDPLAAFLIKPSNSFGNSFDGSFE